MITEDRVTFEIAKLLRDKGFEQDTVSYPYYTDNGNLFTGDVNTPTQRYYNAASAPTLQMVLKWLREVHGIFIEITCCVNDKYDFYVGVYIKGNECWDRCNYYPEGFETFEEACNTGIEYTLENLI